MNMDSSDGGSTLSASVVDSLLRKWQILLDKTTPHAIPRWVSFGVLVLLYMLRVYYLNGWFIVTYGLGIYLLNLFIGFLSPQVDPELEGPGLPTSNSEEFRPFSRRVPEFKFWTASCRAVLVAFFMTFFSVFDVPVFWPILLVYFIVLFFLTMKKRIQHMIKHNYVPWDFGKKTTFKGKGKSDK